LNAPDIFLRQGGASAAHVIGVSIAVIMAWGLWKFLASTLLYILDTCLRASIFLKRHSFDKLLQLL
jgi:hypothetical protein